MDRGTIAVIALCLVLVAWYAIGYVYNLRRGRRLFNWLQTGVEVLGGETTAGWIGSAASGARIQVLHADAPFRRLEVTMLLARREIPLLWLLDHLRDRRDRLIIKATLRSPRPGELEVAPSRRSLLVPSPVDYGRELTWLHEEGPGRLLVARRGSGAERQVASLWSWLQDYGYALRRFAWQKSDPHIQVHLDLAKWGTISSSELLEGLRIAVSVPHMNN